MLDLVPVDASSSLSLAPLHHARSASRRHGGAAVMQAPRVKPSPKRAVRFVAASSGDPPSLPPRTCSQVMDRSLERRTGQAAPMTLAYQRESTKAYVKTATMQGPSHNPPSSATNSAPKPCLSPAAQRLIMGDSKIGGTPFWRALVFGCAAPWLSLSIINPLCITTDKTLKRKYRHVVEAAVETLRTEGLGGLMPQMGSELVNYSIRNTIKIGLYERITSFVSNLVASAVSRNVVSRIGVASVADLFLTPVKFIQKELRQVPGPLLHRIPDIVRSAGASSMFRGLELNMIRSGASTTVVYFGIKHYKSFIQEHVHVPLNPKTIDMASELGATLTQCLVLSPYDKVTALMRSDATVGWRDAWAKSTANGLHQLFSNSIAMFGKNGPQLVLSYYFLERMRGAWQRYSDERDRIRHLRLAFAEFDKNGNGRIDESELMDAFLKAFPPASQDLAQVLALSEAGAKQIRLKRMTGSEYHKFVQSHVHELMERMDRNHSGDLDLAEFTAVSSEVHEIVQRAEVRELFDELDTDKSGTVSRAELIRALKIVAPPDPNTPGLHGPEYSRMIKSFANHMMHVADKDQSGSVDFDEFYSMTRNLEDLCLRHGLKSWLQNAGVGFS